MAEMACDDDTDGIFTYVCAFYLQNDGTNFRKYVSSLYATDYVSMFAISRLRCWTVPRSDQQVPRRRIEEETLRKFIPVILQRKRALAYME